MNNEQAPEIDRARFITKSELFVFAISVCCMVIACLGMEIFSYSSELKQVLEEQKQTKAKYESRERLAKQREELFDSEVFRYQNDAEAKASAIYPQIFDRLSKRTKLDMMLLKIEDMYHWRAEGLFGANKMNVKYAFPWRDARDIEVKVIRWHTMRHERIVGKLNFVTDHFDAIFTPPKTKNLQHPIHGEIQIRWFNADGQFVIECNHVDEITKQTIRRSITLEQPRNRFGNQSRDWHRDSLILLPGHASRETNFSQKFFYRSDPESGHHEVIEIAVRVAPDSVHRMQTWGFELIHRIAKTTWESKDLEEKYDFDNVKDCRVPLLPRVIADILDETQ